MLYCVLWCDISGVTLITIVMVLQFHASGGCEVRGGRWEVLNVHIIMESSRVVK